MNFSKVLDFRKQQVQNRVLYLLEKDLSYLDMKKQRK